MDWYPVILLIIYLKHYWTYKNKGGMYLKRYLVLLLSISLLLVSCSNGNESKIIRKLEKTLEKHKGYTTEVDMRTIMDNNENLYKMYENYTNGSRYRLEIIQPEESKGIIIQYDDDKIYIEHATIDQSISLTNVKTFNKGFLLGEYLKDLSSIKSIKIEEIQGEEFYVLNNYVENRNKYTNEVNIWLYKKNFIPYMLKIIDEDKNPRVIIKYMNFKYLKK